MYQKKGMDYSVEDIRGKAATDLLSSIETKFISKYILCFSFMGLYYTVSLCIICFIYIFVIWRNDLMIDALLDQLQFTWRDFLSLFFFMRIYVTVEVVPSEVDNVFLRKAKNIYHDFIEKATVQYIGIHWISLPNVSGVRYPVDFFIKHFYDRFHTRECIEAMGKYKRVNPDLDLRLQHLEEYTVTRDMVVTPMELDGYVETIVNEFACHDSFISLATELITNHRDRDFYSLDVDLTSASGYPFPAGSKRRETIDAAASKAQEMMNNEGKFDEYMSDHVWYTTGRARMRDRDGPDKGRLIMYPGFSYMLIAMLSLQPIARFMRVHMEWYAVGMSWMHGGARKFAEYFCASHGMAPAGYRYVSVDIKSWDAHLHPTLMRTLHSFYSRILVLSGLNSSDVDRFLIIIDDMIEAKVLFPGGQLFQVFQGMKSGWPGTVEGNSIIHEVVFRSIELYLNQSMKHQIYGDDNFILVPDCISDDALSAAYERCGCVVGTIHSSRYMGDVDFLAKHVHYRDGEYFVYRPAVETHARLIMPEELNPGMRSRADAEIAAERALGHLLDNPFCKNVRDICFDLLKRLRDDYNIREVFVDEIMKKTGPWNRIDVLGPVPCVPSISFIEDLYGVSPVPLRRPWPGRVSIIRFDEAPMENSTIRFDTAYGYARDVTAKVGVLSRKRFKKLIANTSPYCVPPSVYGTHAARLEFAVRYFSLSLEKVLDFGSHPGACAASMLKRSKDVTCVSLKPSEDRKQPFCPYVFKSDDVKFLELNADEFVPNRHYTCLHDDVDVLGSRTREVDINLFERAILRAIRIADNLDSFVCTLHDVCPRTVEALYKCYCRYGTFDIVKPHFSHPWRCEFMVCFKRTSAPLIRKRDFLQKLNGFFNKHAASMIEWSDCLADSYEDLITDHGYSDCPLQSDKRWHDEISRDYLF